MRAHTYASKQCMHVSWLCFFQTKLLIQGLRWMIKMILWHTHYSSGEKAARRRFNSHHRVRFLKPAWSFLSTWSSRHIAMCANAKLRHQDGRAPGDGIAAKEITEPVVWNRWALNSMSPGIPEHEKQTNFTMHQNGFGERRVRLEWQSIQERADLRWVVHTIPFSGVWWVLVHFCPTTCRKVAAESGIKLSHRRSWATF